MVAMRLRDADSSSSQVTISRLLCDRHHCAYGPMLVESQPSPWAIEPSCMSLLRSGTTIATVGSWLKSVGKSVNGRLVVGSSWFAVGVADCQSDHGLCLRAYAPLVNTSEPTPGSPCE